MAEMTPYSVLPDGVLSREVSEARFKKLFDEADAMSIQGYLPDGTVVYWNQASEKIYGYTAAEALGGNLLDLIIPADIRSEVEGAVHWMFESGQGIPAGRLELKHKNGHSVHVHSSHTVISIPDHPPILFCMDADMSSLVRAESELRIAAAAFESQQGMFITDANGIILRVNQMFSQITGYSAEEAVGRTPRLIRSDYHPATFYETMWQSLLDNGFWQGEVWNRRKSGEVYANWISITAVRDSKGQITHYVCSQIDITQRKDAEAQIMHLAFYDVLTRLPNRRLLLDRLQQAVAASIRNQNVGALLFIDLDNFKTLNDTLGHDVGDRLLQQVAERITACIRKNDTAARLGGDEFLVMLEDLSQNPQEAATQAEAAAQKILEALNQNYQLGSQNYMGSVSIGITLFSSQGNSSVDELMKQADLAMYEAKSSGRNSLRFFDPEMQAAVTFRAELLTGLRDALREQQFRLYYQPQVDAEGHITGVEALIRWERPGLGLVSPADFIPVAEESGLIQPIGLWVLETACRQLACWAASPDKAKLTIAVNVSAIQFNRADFVGQVLAILQRTGANPQQLKLELTESLLVDKVDNVIAKMSELKAQGVGFSLDDFGTGYSSLAYLRRLPLDQLKIDRSFVRELLEDPNCVAIAQTIIVLGQTMKLLVIAEGVETENQRALLANLGCYAYQGYLFGRPLPIEQFDQLLIAQAITTEFVR